VGKNGRKTEHSESKRESPKNRGRKNEKKKPGMDTWKKQCEGCAQQNGISQVIDTMKNPIAAEYGKTSTPSGGGVAK